MLLGIPHFIICLSINHHSVVKAEFKFTIYLKVKTLIVYFFRYFLVFGWSSEKFYFSLYEILVFLSLIRQFEQYMKGV